MHDAAVVGGGPAGTITAALIAKDHDVIVLEEHTSSGLPMQCAGIVTPDVLDMCGVRPDILNRIRGADVIFPGGGKLEVRSPDDMAVLIDRTDLDRKLANKATDAGAEIRYGVKYTGHRIAEDRIDITTDAGEMTSKLLIGADGCNSGTAMSLGDNHPKEYVFGIQADAGKRPEHDDVITLRLGSEFAPGFFSWEVPFGDRVRIGLCISPAAEGTPNDYLKRLLKAAGIDEKDVVSKYAGKIPLGGRQRTYGERTLLIGDAAGQVKPISGGGLYPICKAAPILARTVEESIRTDTATSKFLSRYEERWKKEIGKELTKGYRIRKIFTKLSDKDLDKVFDIFDRDDMRSILGNIDLDDPGAVSSPILRKPGVCARLLPLMIRAII
jgi:geranylgeranyl reductase family protein